MKQNIRTDLAIETHKLSQNQGKKLNGIKVENKIENSLNVSTIDVLNNEGSKTIGKPIGRYITIECPNLRFNPEEIESVSKTMSQKINELANISESTTTLVVGLGNSHITPDALGNDVINQLLITHHIKSHSHNSLSKKLSGVCAIAPGVLGTTGIETSTIIQSISKSIKPDLVIIIDALAAADISRVATTIQISNTGIQPGAGVGNNRKGITKKELNANVIAIGVPTVIDARNISDVEIPEELSPLMVTTTDIDLVIKNCSKAIAGGINLALHKNMTLDEIMALTT